jgi:hypothetical protein
VTAPLNPQNVIAVIWDFDKTMIPGVMQAPLFEAYGVDAATFFREADALPAFLGRVGVHVHPDAAYLVHLLTYVRQGRLADLTNAKLRALGTRIAFREGLPELLTALRAEVRGTPAEVEHYIVSTGLREMIEGSAIRSLVDGVWASELIEVPPPPGFDPAGDPEAGRPVSQIAIAYDNTSKTRALFEINKGSNKDPRVDVNASMRPEDRRVPFEHMIYVADGPSDVPAFSLVRSRGGAALAVYDPARDESFEQADRLQREGRVDYFGPADYTPGSATTRWLRLHVRRVAEGIARARETALTERVGRAPRHLG